MKPPYRITPDILKLVSSISEQIGEANSHHLDKPPAELRKRNRIQTIQSTLEIEGNTLTVEQITGLLNNKRVLAPKKDLLEVQNAIGVYNRLDEFIPSSLLSLCQAHKLLMSGLIPTAGKLRTTDVGIVKGEEIAHMAPPSHLIKTQLSDLLRYVKQSPDLELIKSCVFHYELEFIHPFSDGNGRMGRLWQTIILRKHAAVFDFLPIETLIKTRQEAYYQALSASDKAGESTPFIHFMLQVIHDSLTDFLQSGRAKPDATQRLQFFKDHIGSKEFTRKDYLSFFKSMSSATASRDLLKGVEDGMLMKQGDKRTTLYRYR